MFKQSTKKTTVNVLEQFMPFIIISKIALAKMQLYIEGCSDEIGWLGTVTKNDENIFFINDVFLFEQDVHGTTTEITPDGLMKFAEELLQQPDGLETWNNLKLWGHSHVNMAVFASSQDDKQMEAFSNGSIPWFLRIIANKSGDITVDLYDYSQGITYLNLPWWEEYTDEERKIENQIKELQSKLSVFKDQYVDEFKPLIVGEIKEKVSSKVSGFNYLNRYNSTDKSVNSYNGYIDDYDTLWYRHSDDGTIKNHKDVYEYVDEISLMEIAQCHNYEEAKELITVLIDDYGHKENYIIWQAAKDKYGSKVG